MSMFGLGRPQPSSAEKIAAAEQEMDLITDMFNKYASLPSCKELSNLCSIISPICRIPTNLSQTSASLHEEVYTKRVS